jgi:hypothetical protein
MFRPTLPSAARTVDITSVRGPRGWRAAQQCKCHVAYITVTHSQVDPLLQWQRLICRNWLVRVDSSATLFELLVPTRSGRRESEAPARLDSIGRSVRWRRYSVCVHLDIQQFGVRLLPWKDLFRSPKMSPSAVGLTESPVQPVSGTPSWRRYRSAWNWRPVFIQYRD